MSAVTESERSLLRSQAGGLRRLADHVHRGSATPGQIAQAIRSAAGELDRMAGPGPGRLPGDPPGEPAPA